MAAALEKLSNYDFSIVLTEGAKLGCSETTPVGWVEINVTTDKQDEFEPIAKWAVQEHNAKTGDCLVFKIVTNGWMKEIEDFTVYMLILEAKNGVDCNKYATTVTVFGSIKKLLNFTMVPPPHN